MLILLGAYFLSYFLQKMFIFKPPVTNKTVKELLTIRIGDVLL